MAKKSLVNSFDFTEAKPPKYPFSPAAVGLLMIAIPIAAYAIGMLYIPSEYRLYLQFISFLCVLALVMLWNARINGRTKEALGFHMGGWHSFFSGVSLGVVLVVVSIGLIFLCDGFSLGIDEGYPLWYAACVVLGFLIQSVAEEVLFRGYVQNGTIAATKNPWIGIFVQAFLFVLLHGINADIEPLALCSLFAFGVLFGLLFEYSDSVWFGAGVHFIWYIVPTLLFGMRICGYTGISSILLSTPQGPQILSGGAYGLEASVLTLLVAVSSCALYVLIIQRIEKSSTKKKKAPSPKKTASQKKATSQKKVTSQKKAASQKKATSRA